MKKNRFSGFTLVEMLIVTVILAIISLAIFSTFSNGLKIYNRINSQSTPEEMVIFFDRLGLELRNCVNYTGIDFSGKEDELEFCTFVSSPRMQRKTVGQVKYFFDPAKETVSRTGRDFTALYAQEQGTNRITLSKVRSCVFSYYYLDNQTGEFAWAGEWKNSSLPAAVRVELGFKDDPENKLTDTFNIPLGYVVRNETKKVQ